MGSRRMLRPLKFNYQYTESIQYQRRIRSEGHILFMSHVFCRYHQCLVRCASRCEASINFIRKFMLTPICIRPITRALWRPLHVFRIFVRPYNFLTSWYDKPAILRILVRMFLSGRRLSCCFITGRIIRMCGASGWMMVTPVQFS
jgi:hypothetical protein